MSKIKFQSESSKVGLISWNKLKTFEEEQGAYLANSVLKNKLL